MELLTVRETALALKVTPITVRRYIAAGRLPAVRVGRGVRIRKEAVEQFVEPLVAPGFQDDIPAEVKGQPTSAEDPLWSIIGIGESHGAPDVAENKQRYLADAYAAEGQ